MANEKTHVQRVALVRRNPSLDDNASTLRRVPYRHLPDFGVPAVLIPDHEFHSTIMGLVESNPNAVIYKGMPLRRATSIYPPVGYIRGERLYKPLSREINNKMDILLVTLFTGGIITEIIAEIFHMLNNIPIIGRLTANVAFDTIIIALFVGNEVVEEVAKEVKEMKG